jgi:hypothetical protein
MRISSGPELLHSTYCYCTRHLNLLSLHPTALEVRHLSRMAGTNKWLLQWWRKGAKSDATDRSLLRGFQIYSRLEQTEAHCFTTLENKIRQSQTFEES